MQKGNRKLVAEWCIYEDQIIFLSWCNAAAIIQGSLGGKNTAF